LKYFTTFSQLFKPKLMEEQIRQIAERLKGLRDVMDITAEDAAGACGISTEQYLAFESGKIDIPVSAMMVLN